ncbi:hypothetical protein [Aureimonas sp. AU40]|uniref:hypothetical protein n=1 Tax=Aureimonas sp. AU40 TaxID=1637747 RepID=UPI000784A89C|nr:hypothetical protein [Aureimonas sp. AU40]
MRAFIENFPFSSNRPALAPVFPDYVEEVKLSADTSTLVPLPESARFALFSFDGHVRVRLGTKTTSLSDPRTTSDGSGAEWNPAARRIPEFLPDGVTRPTHLCLRAPAATVGSVSFYA